MSDPRHRLEPAVRSIDFNAVAPPRARATYIPPQRPSVNGPDQWAESPTPESDDSAQLAEATHSSR